MARAPFLRTYTKVIPANGDTGPLLYGGTKFVCKESDAAFDLWMDDVGPNECEVGVGFRFEDEEGNPSKFKQIRMVNTTAAAITVKFWVGSAAVIDSRLNTLITRTILVGSQNAPTQTIGMGAATATASPFQYTGLLGARRRKSFSVFNKSTVDDLIVIAANGAEMWRVPPRQGFVVESGDPISVQGTTASVPYTGVEVFYNT